MAVGSAAAFSTTTGFVCAIGTNALSANTTGTANTAVGSTGTGFLATQTTNTTGSYNSSLGEGTLGNNSTGSYNTALGAVALYNNTTASNNTAVGYQAGYSNTTGAYLTLLGYQAGYSHSTGSANTFIGYSAGYAVTTGIYNTFIGSASATGYSGGLVTTGSKNTIIGNYTGNQGGLDIRTASNYIVLSDGDGNPRQVIDSSGNVGIGNTVTKGRLYVNDNSSSSTTVGTNPILWVGGGIGNNSTLSEIGFTYGTASGVNAGTNPSSTIGIQLTSGSGYTKSDLTFATRSVTTDTAPTERMRIDSSGNVTLQKNISVGGATPTTSGTGITFPATQSASSDANTLDDYEEGTWTPSPTNLTVVGTPTYSGKYTKIGNCVTAVMTAQATTSTASTTGSTYFSGLPFTPITYASTCINNANTQTSIGCGSINSGLSRYYTPTYTSGAGEMIVSSFTYYI